MRFGRIVVIYFIMGVVVWGGGPIDFADTGLVEIYVNDSGGSVNESSIVAPGEDDSSGMLENLLGPVREALNTVAGGSIVAAFGAIDKLLGFYAWPTSTMIALKAPREIVALSGALVVSFTMAVVRVIRSSV